MPRKGQPVAYAGRHTTTQRLRIETHRSIHDVDADLWESILDRDDLLARHSFLRVVEASAIEDADYWYVLGFRGCELEFHACLCGLTVSLDVLAGAGVRRLTELLRPVAPGLLKERVLFCGLPVSFGQSSLRFADHADKNACIGALAQLMERLGRESGAPLLCFKEFGEAEADALEALCRLGYMRVPSLPGNDLDVRWKSFDEYVAAMRSGYRRQLRQDLRAARKAGLTVEWLRSIADERERMYCLYTEVIARAEHRLEVLPLSFFRLLEREMSNEVSGVVLRRGEDAIAGAVTLAGPSTFVFLLAGVNYEACRNIHGYQNLIIEIVRRGIMEGFETVRLGQTSDAMKSRLGAHATSRFLFLKARNQHLHRLIRLGATMLFPKTQHLSRRVFRS